MNFGENWKSEPVKIPFADNLGLIPTQIIYVETFYNSFVNEYIQENYNDIVSRFKQKSAEIDFIYLPKITKDLFQSPTAFQDLLKYFFPDRINQFRYANRIQSMDSPITSFITERLFPILKFENERFCGFLRLSENHDPSTGNYLFEYYAFDCSKKKILESQIAYYISGIHFDTASGQITFNPSENSIFSPCRPIIGSSSDEKTMPCIETNSPVFYLEEARADFYDEYNTIETIKNDILRLKQLGFYVPLMQAIGGLLLPEMGEKSETKLSRLIIDPESYTIYLQDYNNMEITMTTLPKTLYIFFLRHPEGIILKQLSDYEPELMAIYKLISNREKIGNMEESIHRMCSPLDASINEKLSRIKEAFVRKIPENGYAEHYFVTGDRGEKKQIRIDRRLVSLPNGLQAIQ